MATISFYVNGPGFSTEIPATSGLGFYGSGFRTSVAVGSYQRSTYITDGYGIVEGAMATNIKYVHLNSGLVNEVTTSNLTGIPNAQATMNIRFTHSSPVAINNVELRIYDRSNEDRDPSGVTCQVAEISHLNATFGSGVGNGNTEWTNAHGSGQVLALSDSPCTSGISGGRGHGGEVETDTRHDWYLALSCTPTSIGAKTNFGLYVSLEYL